MLRVKTRQTTAPSPLHPHQPVIGHVSATPQPPISVNPDPIVTIWAVGKRRQTSLNAIACLVNLDGSWMSFIETAIVFGDDGFVITQISNQGGAIARLLECVWFG